LLLLLLLLLLKCEHVPDPGEFIAQYKYTVLVLASGQSKITVAPSNEGLTKSEHKIEDADLLALLSQSVSTSKKNKKKKAKKTGEAGAVADGPKGDAAEEEGDDE